ncbi:MAG: hypothetical protein AAF399_10765 [Bacteroidota bacterium]
MESLTVEYLMVVDKRQPLLKPAESLNHLLKACSDIEIEKDKLIFLGQSYQYQVLTDELVNGDRSFHLGICCPSLSLISPFQRLLDIVKDLLSKVAKEEPTELWDDVSFHYANQAYPLIHQVENLMRKLITKFMFSKVGVDWTQKFVPDGVLTSTKRRNHLPEDGNYLYQTDFIQLAHFLFQKIKNGGNIGNLYRVIRNAESVNDLKLENLKKWVPQSNWERYFSQYVSCDPSELKDNWQKLYGLRCKVAHNNTLS